MPRFLIAPDKFKGSLSAHEAAEAIAKGIRQTSPDADIDLCPIADGGEGFMESLATAMRAEWIQCPAVDALNRPIQSRYALATTNNKRTAIMEMAETAGLWRITNTERNPLRTTTKGTGMQIAHAIRKQNASRIILGIGGSATNDGGSGMASALGISFLNAHNQPLEPTPANLPDVHHIDHSNALPLPEIIAACDVDNHLLGPTGATYVFSPQKGATPSDLPTLEAALSHLVHISNGNKNAATPGAGAAGGLGFGLLHFANARLMSGFDLIADILNLESRIRNANHVITGEGSLDHQSLSGKGPVALARMAAKAGIPTTAFCGYAEQSVHDSKLFQSIHALADNGLPLDQLINNAAQFLTNAAAQARFT